MHGEGTEQTKRAPAYASVSKAEASTYHSEPKPPQPALAKAYHAFVSLYTADVEAHPTAYKERVRQNPAAHAHFLLDGLNLKEVRQLTADLREEIRAVAKAQQ